MKCFLRQMAAIVSILACIACLSGCFDRRELDTLGIVLGVAIDKAEKDGETTLTVQMANPAGAESSKSKKDSGGEGGGAFINVTGTGKNINYTVREMQHEMSRRIYVAHSQVIVLGEALAKEGVRDALDFFARAPEARMTLFMFVAKGKAGDILNIKPDFEKTPSVELAKILKDQKITSHAPIVTEFEFVSAMVSKTTAAVAPLVRMEEKDEEQRLIVAGCAVFKESRMVGEFDDMQTRGFLYIKNKVKTGVMQLSIMDTPATIEIRRVKTKVTPELFTDGKAEFTVETDITVGLGDQSGSVNLADPENTPAMLDAVRKAVEEEIQSAVSKSKELNADVFGFGDYLNRKYPDQWKNMKKNWDELYKGINVNVTVKAKADGSGRIAAPLVPKEA